MSTVVPARPPAYPALELVLEGVKPEYLGSYEERRLVTGTVRDSLAQRRASQPPLRGFHAADEYVL